MCKNIERGRENKVNGGERMKYEKNIRKQDERQK